MRMPRVLQFVQTIAKSVSCFILLTQGYCRERDRWKEGAIQRSRWGAIEMGADSFGLSGCAAVEISSRHGVRNLISILTSPINLTWMVARLRSRGRTLLALWGHLRA